MTVYRAPVAPSASLASKTRWWQRPILSLRNRNFRWFWLGMLASFTAMQMDTLARGWLAFRMTGSTLALGVITAAWGIPVLILSPLGGVITDRVDKRNLLIATQVWVGVIALALAALILTGAIRFELLFMGVLLIGVAWAFNMPGRQAFTPELVAPEELMNAIALNSSGMNLTRVFGPGVAGLLVAKVDVGGVYVIMVVCYLLVVLSLLQIPPAPKSVGPQKPSTSLWTELGSGFSYVGRHRTVLVLLIMELILVAFGMPYQSFMPVFAVKVFDVGAEGLGLLLGVTGFGALVGSLAIASLGTSDRKGQLLLGTALVFGITLFLFTLTPSFPLALFILFFVGMTGTSYFALNNTLIISNTPRDMLGRVMSIYMMTFGMMPFAALPAGAIAEVLGVSMTIAAGAAILATFFLGVLFLYPAVRRLT